MLLKKQFLFLIIIANLFFQSLSAMDIASPGDKKKAGELIAYFHKVLDSYRIGAKVDDNDIVDRLSSLDIGSLDETDAEKLNEIVQELTSYQEQKQSNISKTPDIDIVSVSEFAIDKKEESKISKSITKNLQTLAPVGDSRAFDKKKTDELIAYCEKALDSYRLGQKVDEKELENILIDLDISLVEDKDVYRLGDILQSISSYVEGNEKNISTSSSNPENGNKGQHFIEGKNSSKESISDIDQFNKAKNRVDDLSKIIIDLRGDNDKLNKIFKSLLLLDKQIHLADQLFTSTASDKCQQSIIDKKLNPDLIESFKKELFVCFNLEEDMQMESAREAVFDIGKFILEIKDSIIFSWIVIPVRLLKGECVSLEAPVKSSISESTFKCEERIDELSTPSKQASSAVGFFRKLASWGIQKVSYFGKTRADKSISESASLKQEVKSPVNVCQSSIPSSISTPEVKTVTKQLLPTDENIFPVKIDRVSGNYIVDYLYKNSSVARLINVGNSIHFGGQDPNKYNFSLEAPAKLDDLEVNLIGGLKIETPMITSTAIINCNSIDFKGNFSSEKDIVINADILKCFDTVKCLRIIFKGDYAYIEKGSVINASSIELKGKENIDINGEIISEEDLLLHSKYIINFNKVKSNRIHIKADRLFLNIMLAQLDAKEDMTIDALISLNMALASIWSNNLTINSAFSANLLGLYCAYTTNINSLIDISPLGVSLPNLVKRPELITKANAIKAAKGIVGKFCPIASTLIFLGENVYALCQGDGILQQGKQLVDKIVVLYKNPDSSTSEWIALICEAKNLASTAHQLASSTKTVVKATVNVTGDLTQILKDRLNKEKKKDKAPDSSSSNSKESKEKQVSSSSNEEAKKGTEQAESSVQTEAVESEKTNANSESAKAETSKSEASSSSSSNQDSSSDATSSNSKAKTESIAEKRIRVGKKVGASVVSAIVSAVGPSVNKDTLVDVNAGATLGINGHSRSLVDANLGVCGHLNTHTVSTVHSVNTGVNVAGTLDIKASKSCTNAGVLAGHNVNIETESYRGTSGSSIKTSSDQARIKASAINNKGTTNGTLVVEFTGDSGKLESVGNVGSLVYHGTASGEIADKLAKADGSLVKVSEGGTVVIVPGKEDVHFQEKHDINHGLEVYSEGEVQSDQPIASSSHIVIHGEDIIHDSLDAPKSVQVVAKKTVTSIAKTNTSSDGKNYKTEVTPVNIKSENIHVQAGEHIVYKGVKTESGRSGTVFLADGCIIDAVVRGDSHQEDVETKAGTTTTSNGKANTLETCEHKSAGKVQMVAGDTCELQGTTFDAKGGTFVYGRNGVFGLNAIGTREEFTEFKKDGGCFGNTKTGHESSSQAADKPVEFKGGVRPVIQSDRVVALACTSDTETLKVISPELHLSRAKRAYASNKKHSSANAILVSGGYRTEEGTTYSETPGEVETDASKIYVEDIEGIQETKFITEGSPEIKRTFVKEKYKLHKKRRYIVPTKATAMVVVLAVSLATSGVGAYAGSSLSTYMGLKSAILSKMVASSTAAGVNSVISQATNSLLYCNGDIAKAAKMLVSTDTLKSITMSSVISGCIAGSDGILDKVGLPAVQEAQHIGQRIMYLAPRQFSGATIKALANIAAGANYKDAALDNLKSAIAETLGISCTTEIGKAYGEHRIDPVTHKILHAMVGAASGGIMGGKDGAISGATGAFIAEAIADLLSPLMPFDKIKAIEDKLGHSLSEDEFNKLWLMYVPQYIKSATRTENFAKLAAATVALLSKQDVSIAQFTSGTAIDHNYLMMVLSVAATTARLAYSGYKIYKAYEEGDGYDVVHQVAMEVAENIDLVPFGKVISRIGRAYRFFRLVDNKTASSSPKIITRDGRIIPYVCQDTKNEVISTKKLTKTQFPFIGCRGEKLTKLDRVCENTGLIRVNTERKGSFEDVIKFKDEMIREDFSHLQLKDSYECKKSGRVLYTFSDGSTIQTRPAGKVGDPKLDIYDAGANLYEKITFKINN